MEMGVAAKAAAGLCLVGGGGAGAYYGYQYLTDREKIETMDKTKYDDALLNFLDASKNQDIIFDVVKANDGSEAALTEEDVKLKAASTKVNVKVRVSTSAKAKFKAESNELDAKLDELKAKNKDSQDWTWTCSFEFKKDASQAAAELEEATRKRIMGAANEGLFGILTKDVSIYTNDTAVGSTKWTKESLTNAKKNFITQCAKARVKENKTIHDAAGLANGTLEVTVPSFAFQKQADGTNLVAKETSGFDEWFPANYGTTQYHTQAA